MTSQLVLTPEVPGRPEFKQQTRDLMYSLLRSWVFLCGRGGGEQGLEDVPEVLGHQWEGGSPAAGSCRASPIPAPPMIQPALCSSLSYHGRWL